MAYLDISGIPIFYVKSKANYGWDSPLILIHGAGGSHRHWLYQMQAAGYPLIIPDLPGHGQSGGSAVSSIEDYADIMLNFGRRISPKGFIIGGHSMGGAISISAFLQAPALVKGLVLVGTGARLRVNPAILDNYQAGKSVPEVIDWSYGSGVASSIKTAALEEWESVLPEVIYRDFKACNDFDVMDRVNRLNHVPTTIICGTSDVMTPPKYAKYLQDEISAELNLIDGAGHMVMLEQAPMVNEIISNFMEILGVC